MNKLSLEEIATSIERADPEEQRRLLSKLPRLLKINASDLGWLKVAERSFTFWDNPQDRVYDRL